MKGRILQLIRIDRETEQFSKGILVKIEAEDGSEKYLSLNKGWEVEFETDPKAPTRVKSLVGVKEERLYPFSG